MQRQRQRQRQGGLRTRSPAQLLHSFDASFSARSCSRLLLRWAWQCAGGVLLRRRGMRRRSRALARQQRQVSSSRVPRAPTYDARVTGGLRASLCAHISLEPSHRAPSPRCPKGGELSLEPTAPQGACQKIYHLRRCPRYAVVSPQHAQPGDVCDMGPALSACLVQRGRAPMPSHDAETLAHHHRARLKPPARLSFHHAHRPSRPPARPLQPSLLAAQRRVPSRVLPAAAGCGSGPPRARSSGGTP